MYDTYDFSSPEPYQNPRQHEMDAWLQDAIPAISAAEPVYLYDGVPRPTTPGVRIMSPVWNTNWQQIGWDPGTVGPDGKIVMDSDLAKYDDQPVRTPSGLPPQLDTALKQGGYGVAVLLVLFMIGVLAFVGAAAFGDAPGFRAVAILITLAIFVPLIYSAFKHPRTAAVIGTAAGAYRVASGVHHHHQQQQANRIADAINRRS